jgi:phosphate transport system substrate-binding protein
MKSHSSSYWNKAMSFVVVGILALVVIVAAGFSAFFVIQRGGINLAGSSSSAQPVDFSVAGSSLMYLALVRWVGNYSTIHPNVRINVDAGGSGLGQQEVETGIVSIGASDAYLLNQTQSEYPWLLDIPLAISAQQVNYDVPGIPQSMHLNFSASVLAEIYNGSIAYWDDPRLISINPAAAHLLTHNQITPLFRSDSSGDTFIFTQYLSSGDSWWGKNVGFGTIVSWPSNPASIGEQGNSAMLVGLGAPYTIGYVGVSYLSRSILSNFGYAYLQNRAGNFVNISSSNMESDATQFSSSVPNDERISMIYGPGANSYPIVNFEYAIVSKNQTNSAVGAAIKNFLTWCSSPTGGNSAYFLDYAHFVALPPIVLQLSDNQINSIQS